VKGLPVTTAIVDGNDVAAVYQAAKAAVDHARAGGGPAVIEAKTYRWYDHSNFAGVKEDMPGAWGLNYRTDFELQQWMARDPIPRFQEFLTAHGIATAEELAAIDQEQLALVTEAIEYGRTSPVANPEMGCENVCANITMTRTQFFNRQGLAA
jgi:pyruvate dehydrogenase E1 component alpha subunit